MRPRIKLSARIQSWVAAAPVRSSSHDRSRAG
jgi:hypothetical protein